MSDPHNVKGGDDPQSRNIKAQNALNKGGPASMFDEVFNDDDGPDEGEIRTENATGGGDDGDGKKKKKKKACMTVTQAYHYGIELFRQRDFFVELDPVGPFCFHSIYRQQAPPEVKGITYPASFRPRLPLLDPRDKDLQELIDFARMQEDETFKELWVGTLDKRFSMDMSRLAQSELMRKSQLATFTETDPLKLRRSFDPLGDVTDRGTCSADPTSWIPARSWFDPKLHDVDFQDVFTIFPDAERELFKLILGRAVVGPTEQIPHGWDEKIEHGARMAAIVIGDPGIGKSTLFERALIPALAKCGYKRGNFQDIGARFGLADVALSDLAYKDDTTRDSLARLMKSEQAKTLISSGQLNTEEKNQKDINVRANTTLLLCANDWNPRTVYDLDSGITDRFKLLRALATTEMERLQQGKEVKGVKAVSELSRSSGHTLNPGTHLRWLANKLDVDVEALMLWCCRIAADEFYRVAIGENTTPGNDLLESRVRELTSKCRKQFHVDVTKTLVMAMIFSTYLRDPDWEMPSLTNKETLHMALENFYFVMADRSCHSSGDRLKERWLGDNRNPIHFYEGIRRINVPTIKKAMVAVKDVWGDNRPLKTHFKRILEQLELRDGFAMNADLSEWTGRWNDLRNESADSLREEALLMREQMTDAELERVSDLALKPDDDWLYGPKYSPENAQFQRPRMK